MTKQASSYNREDHEVTSHHFLGRSCCVPVATTLAVAAGSFSAEDKQCSRIGYQADPEWSDHGGFGSNEAIAEWGCKKP
jgi:hypothetical protein